MFLPKALLEEMSNRTTKANTFSALIQPTFCNMRVDINNILFIQHTLRARKILRKQNTASAETAWQFLASKVLVLRRNKPASSRAPRHPILNCNENPLAR